MGRSVRVLISKEGRRYRKAVTRLLGDHETIDYPVQIGVTVWIRRRGTDVDAMIKPLLDALEHAGLLADDNIVCSLAVSRLYDRENPRVELEIVPVTDPAHVDAIAPSKLAA